MREILIWYVVNSGKQRVTSQKRGRLKCNRWKAQKNKELAISACAGVGDRNNGKTRNT